MRFWELQPALLRGIKIGIHGIPFDVDNPLFWIFWAVLLLGAAVQCLLLRAKRRKWVHWLLAAALVSGLAACEIACQIVIGWELVGLVVLYFCLLTMLLGAGLCALAAALYYRKKNR